MARMPSKHQHVLPTGEILKKLYGFGYFGTKTWQQVKGLKGEDLDCAVRE